MNSAPALDLLFRMPLQDLEPQRWDGVGFRSLYHEVPHQIVGNECAIGLLVDSFGGIGTEVSGLSSRRRLQEVGLDLMENEFCFPPFVVEAGQFNRGIDSRFHQVCQGQAVSPPGTQKVIILSIKLGLGSCPIALRRLRSTLQAETETSWSRCFSLSTNGGLLFKR